MPLQAQYDNAGDVPSEFQSLYTEQDGVFRIQEIDGLVPASERDTLVSSLHASRNDTKQVKENLRQWTALGDLAEIQAKLDRIPELELAAKGSDEETLKQRVEAAANARSAPLQRQLEELTGKFNEANQQIEQFHQEAVQRTISEDLRTHLGKLGITDPEAMRVAVEEGLRVHQIGEDGKVVTSDKYQTPGLRPEVWAKDLQKRMPFLWPGNEPGGARGGKGGHQSGDNPWLTGNITAQSTMMNSDPELAKQLYRQAGDKAKGLPVVA